MKKLLTFSIITYLIFTINSNAINQNLIDVIVSDHKPEDEESKRLPFAQAATGASGIETLLSLLNSAL